MSNQPVAAQAEESSGLPAVLLVEDEPIARQSMRLFLKTCGYAAIEAPTVEHAVELLANGISAAVLDVHLASQRSGLEVLDPLRRRPELADIPVIVLTGGILTDAEEALIRQQHAHVLYKPEGCETIVSYLDRLTGRLPSPIDTRKAVAAGPDEVLRKEFLARTQQECWWLQSGLTAGDYGRARQILHRWVGISGTLGYTDLGRRARELQRLLDEPGAVATERLRAGVNDIARLCSELAQEPFEPATGAALDIRAEPAAGCQSLFHPTAQACAVGTPALARSARLGPLHGADDAAQRAQNSGKAPYSGPSRTRAGIVEALAGGLAGKKIALVGFDESDATWIVHALDQAQAFSRVLGPMEAGAGSHALEPCDLLVLAASAESGEAVWKSGDRLGATSQRVLLIGPTHAIVEWTRKFHNTAHDFLITPCGHEELLLRAYRLLSSAGRRSISPDTSSGARRRVVIADDDPTITALVSAAFQNYDFDCHIARDGGQALDLTRTLQPDALVLDVNMPRFDGFEVLDALKNDPATAGVAVVLLSARQQEADVMRGFALGADDYIVKPFSPVELIARVKRLLWKPAA